MHIIHWFPSTQRMSSSFSLVVTTSLHRSQSLSSVMLSMLSLFLLSVAGASSSSLTYSSTLPLTSSSSSSSSNLTANADNACSRDVLTRREYNVPYHKPVQIVTTTFCLVNWPPVCEQKKTIYKLSYRTETRTRLQKVFYCCPGYAQHGNRLCQYYCHSVENIENP